MEFDWFEYYEIAREHYKKVHTERTLDFKTQKGAAVIRCCISRAYYSAFCTARNHIQQIYPEFNPREDYVMRKKVKHQMSVHAAVYNKYLNESDSKYKSIGKKLQVLLKLRGKADYYNKYDALTDSTNALNIADDIFKLLDKIKKEEIKNPTPQIKHENPRKMKKETIDDMRKRQKEEDKKIMDELDRIRTIHSKKSRILTDKLFELHNIHVDEIREIRKKCNHPEENIVEEEKSTWGGEVCIFEVCKICGAERVSNRDIEKYIKGYDESVEEINEAGLPFKSSNGEDIDYKEVRNKILNRMWG